MQRQVGRLASVISVLGSGEEMDRCRGLTELRWSPPGSARKAEKQGSRRCTQTCISDIHSELQDRGHRAFKQAHTFLKLHRMYVPEASRAWICHGLRAQSRRVRDLMAAGPRECRNSEAEQSGKTSLTGGSQDGSSVSPDPSFWHTPEL